DGIGRVTARWGRHYTCWRRQDGQIVLGRKRIIVGDDKSRRTLVANGHPAGWIGQGQDDRFVALREVVIEDRHDNGLVAFAGSKIQSAVLGRVVLACCCRAVAGGVVHAKWNRGAPGASYGQDRRWLVLRYLIHRRAEGDCALVIDNKDDRRGWIGDVNSHGVGQRQAERFVPLTQNVIEN